LWLGFPGLVMVMEWWASEIAILLAGVANGATGLATLALYQTTNSFCFMFSLGFQVSAGTRVGQSLGRAEPDIGRQAAWIAAFLALIVSALLAAVLFLFRAQIPLLFTGSSPDGAVLARRVSETYGFLSIYVVGDGVCSAFAGAIQGAGRQKFWAAVVVLAYFVIALPLCGWLGIGLGMGYIGIVAAMTLGTWIQCVGNGVIVWSTNFERESAMAIQRAQQNYLELEVDTPQQTSDGIATGSGKKWSATQGLEEVEMG